MKLYGLQKLTLLDYPGHTACTVFTGGCNFRCPFCHNALLVTQIDSSCTYEDTEIFDFLKKRQGLLDGVCVTGGEPLMQKDIFDFIKQIKDMDFAVKLDTNGSFPDKLKELIDNKLIDYVAMDIKNSKERYAETVGVEGYDISPIEKSVEILFNSNIDFEFRTTIVDGLHTVEDIENIGKWIKNAPRYFLQNFVDSGNLIGENMKEVPKEVMLQMRDVAKKYVPVVEVRGI